MEWAFDWRRYTLCDLLCKRIYHLHYSNCASYKYSIGRCTWGWYCALLSRTTKQVLASYPALPYSFAIPQFLTSQDSKYGKWSVALHHLPEDSKPVVSRPRVDYKPRSWSCTTEPTTRTQEILTAFSAHSPFGAGILHLTATGNVINSHAQHNDVSVNDGPHIRRWPHKIIIL